MTHVWIVLRQMAAMAGLVVFGLLPVAASADELEDVIAAVEAKYGEVEAMKASFVQTTKSEVFGEETQQGDVLLKRPSKMKWHFKGDNEKQFVTDGTTMWVYTHADKQVIKYDDVSQASSGADSLLQSLDKLSELFEVTLLAGEAGSTLHKLGLKPRGEQGQFKTMDLVLDAAYVVKVVTIVDQFDNVTQLEFSQVQLDVEVPDAAFAFAVPDGVEVISTGGM